MTARQTITVSLFLDDWGLKFQHQVKGKPGDYGGDNEYAIYRPVPSKAYHEPQRVFNKLRSVEDSEFAGGRDFFNVTFVGKGYALVHTKDTKFGKTGRRELWAWHGTVPGSGFSRDAWEPYSVGMEYWKSPVTGEGALLTDEMIRKSYAAGVNYDFVPDTTMPFSPDDEYTAYVAEVSDEKMWKRTNRFIRELQKQ